MKMLSLICWFAGEALTTNHLNPWSLLHAVSRFSPPTTLNVDISWKRSNAPAAPPTPRCCSTPWTRIRCHTGSQTCRGSARTSATSSTTPAGGTYQVITHMIITIICDLNYSPCEVLWWYVSKHIHVNKGRESRHLLPLIVLKPNCDFN